MKFSSHSFDDLTPRTLKALYHLTNAPERGDVRDSGFAAGSLFRNQLDERLMGESFPNTTVVLAKHHFRLAGWSMLTRHDLDPDTGRKLLVPSAQVGFYVHPDFRRQGLGKQLLQEAQVTARKLGIGRLLANPWNKSSHSFFHSCGFEDVQEYVSGFNHGIAALSLDPSVQVRVRVG